MTSNMWSHLGAYRNFFFVIDQKQKKKILEPKPKIKEDDKREENLVNIKVASYNYNECRKALEKIIILNELSFNFVDN